MGPYCKFCQRRCFTHLPEGTPQSVRDVYKSHGFTSPILATCFAGQDYEREKFGWCYSDIVEMMRLNAGLKQIEEEFA